MVVCTQCGGDNPLGRLFCIKCGARLDLRNMSSASVAAKRGGARLPALLPQLIRFLMLLLLVLIGLAFWPQSGPIGGRGSEAGAQNVSRTLRNLQALGRGRTMSATFTEQDVNGYFEHVRAPKMKLDSVSLRMQGGYFTVRVMEKLGPSVFESLHPRMSSELICVPLGRNVRVVRASVGHLTWLGPLKGLVAHRLVRRFASEPEWAVFRDIDELRAEEGRIWISVKKR